MSTAPKITTLGHRELTTINNQHYQRKKGTEEWIPYYPDTPPSALASGPEPVYLSLIREAQGPGEPHHWALFVARENQSGYVYQVKGDAEFMSYEPSEGVVGLEVLEGRVDVFVLGVLEAGRGEEMVRRVAGEESPPKARSRREVRENCQGWVVRVLERLVGAGVLGEEKLGMVRGMMEPV
ncbi:uncharacterized protein BO80DRAFT_476881 [Aspergillus ibericus CBS 121593]|uniref:Uncharacterized protein n=1 Tax=Aspergillus ibericus CBS 121593 TaxID=1448316 RepID=A0A395GWK3_9EURO|nr:hypothetical protein BO80DRAFT_476881 [Aspergillus ibericus CBS 121593]RAK99905.1 hypothetical protein BO80DRAFT_476881 [Aspergillus ibericus CBS 121593]